MWREGVERTRGTLGAGGAHPYLPRDGDGVKSRLPSLPGRFRNLVAMVLMEDFEMASDSPLRAKGRLPVHALWAMLSLPGERGYAKFDRKRGKVAASRTDGQDIIQRQADRCGQRRTCACSSLADRTPFSPRRRTTIFTARSRSMTSPI